MIVQFITNQLCQFSIAEQLEIEAPVIVIVEAKRSDINSGMGQCMAVLAAGGAVGDDRI